MDGQQIPGGDMASKIRLAAQQSLNPQELQIVAQTITPQFIQVMAKLFGDQAVMLLGPLVNIQQTPLQNAPAAQPIPNANPLQNFTVPQQAMQPVGGMNYEGEDEGICPGCQDPNCPDCQMMRNAPSGVRFGR